MKLVKSSILLTPELANEYLKINTYIAQRHFDRRFKKELARKIKIGLFHEGCIAIMHYLNGKSEMMNGQHQCEAVIECHNNIECRLHDYFQEPEDTEEDVAKVFAQYDVHKARTRRNVSQIYAVQFGMAEWPISCTRLCASALSLLESNLDSPKITYDETGHLLGQYKEDCVFIRNLLFESSNSKRSKHLQRAGVAAAIIATRRVNEHDAILFWTDIRDGELLERNDITYKVREFLMKIKINIGGGARDPGYRHVSTKHAYCYCIGMWNKFRGYSAGGDYKWRGNTPIPK